MSKLRVSIIIVNWKTPRLLAGCLDSLAQDRGCEQFEIFVVDNASGDETLDILASNYPAVKVIANKENVGFSRACNQAIPEASGKYVLLLNPDTVISDSAVSRLADFMDQNEGSGAAGPRVLNPDGSLQLACRRAFPDPLASFFRLSYLSRIFPSSKLMARYNMTYANPDSLLEVDALSGSCMMVRSAVIDEIGLLDEEIFMFGEDIDWCWRIKQAGFAVYYVPDSVVYHYHGAASRKRPVGAAINLHKGMEVFYRKHLAAKHWAPFNLLVYAAIWFRASIFIVIGLFQQLSIRDSADPEQVIADPAHRTKVDAR